jgi:hypothetical protein
VHRIVWTATKVEYSVDGVVRFTATSHVPQVAMYPILVYGVGANNAACRADATTPSKLTMDVDYLRVVRTRRTRLAAMDARGVATWIPDLPEGRDSYGPRRPTSPWRRSGLPQAVGERSTAGRLRGLARLGRLVVVAGLRLVLLLARAFALPWPWPGFPPAIHGFQPGWVGPTRQGPPAHGGLPAARIAVPLTVSTSSSDEPSCVEPATFTDLPTNALSGFLSPQYHAGPADSSQVLPLAMSV